MNKQHIELYICLFAWFAVIVVGFILWLSGDTDIKPAITGFNIAVALTLYALFMAGYLISRYERWNRGKKEVQLWGFALASLSILALSLFYFYNVIGVLAAILVAQLPDFFRQKHAWFIAALIPLLFTSLDTWLKGSPFYYENSLLFSIFNLLVLLTSYRFVAERQAKNESKQLVRELTATQILLGMTTKRDERLRIARDLHDVLGHKLTALSLQLEVASHVKGAELQEAVQRAKYLSGFLLSDVREAVSEIRSQKDIDLRDALTTLTRNIPGLKVDLRIDLEEALTDARQAEVIFRCLQEALTNTIKHANASRCDVRLSSEEQRLILSVEDNGKNDTEIKPGNGLNGMAERIKKIDGELDYQNDANGFKLVVRLPKY